MMDMFAVFVVIACIVIPCWVASPSRATMSRLEDEHRSRRGLGRPAMKIGSGADDQEARLRQQRKDAAKAFYCQLRTRP